MNTEYELQRERDALEGLNNTIRHQPDYIVLEELDFGRHTEQVKYLERMWCED